MQREKWLEDTIESSKKIIIDLQKELANSSDFVLESGSKILWYEYEKLGLKAFFIDNNIKQAKQYFYNCGKLDEFLIVKFDSKILDYGINHLTYALLSDNEDLIQRYSNLRHSNYDAMIKSGGTAPTYILQCLIKDDWSEFEKVMPIMKSKTVKKFKMELDALYFEALAERNKSKIEEILAELVTPKIHKQRNKIHELINEFVSHPALGYAKLAWRKGIEVEVKSELVPSELLPIRPLDEYMVQYDFLKEFL